MRYRNNNQKTTSTSIDRWETKNGCALGRQLKKQQQKKRDERLFSERGEQQASEPLSAWYTSIHQHQSSRNHHGSEENNQKNKCDFFFPPTETKSPKNKRGLGGTNSLYPLLGAGERGQKTPSPFNHSCVHELITSAYTYLPIWARI